ncbi:uncharacterized protein [Aegilops tauschii subsp. strangulata]|uniref:uncharacterized protein n=1 Tax=Aegilops tauschii subsp. strangulata TaxID=200361 RepID=UPI001E1CA58E|nr:uncharacterized protein LOC109744268 [Aegilops tauschii subsp. strangulata]
MLSNGGQTVSVKLFIDKEKKRVLFAESDKDFVDILFSFLTLPLGAIVRLFKKQAQMGCLDELYKSVDALGAEHFQTTVCKTMLLSPVNAAAFHCDRLKVKVDDANRRVFYVSTSKNCMNFSPVAGGCCSCGGLKYIVTDDLQVSPASTSLVFSLFDRFGLQEQAKIEEKILHLNANKVFLRLCFFFSIAFLSSIQITSLLKRALMSKQALTWLCFEVSAASPGAVNIDKQLGKKQANETPSMFTAIKIKLVHTKDESSVLYAEVGEDFVDMIFGLLCFPLGSVTKTFGQMPPNGCISTLYASVDGSARGCVKHECRHMLVSPQLAPFFGCSKNILQADELPPRSLTFGCLRCLRITATTEKPCNCILQPHLARKPTYGTINEINPKSAYQRAYIKGGPRNFLVTNDLRVIHFSLTNTLQILREARIPKEKLVEKEIALNKTQVPLGCLLSWRASSLFISFFVSKFSLTDVRLHSHQVLKLVRAALVTRDALGSVLLPSKE